MYFITTKRMLEVCFSAHPNIQYRTYLKKGVHFLRFLFLPINANIILNCSKMPYDRWLCTYSYCCVIRN